MFSDTPLPPEEPAGQNPPDGAIFDYNLPRGAFEVSLEIVAPDGNVVRRFSSTERPEVVDPDTLPHPTYWIRPPQRLGTGPGHHRFVWDLRREPPRGARRQFSIAAVHGRTPSGPHGPFAHPGRYTVRLTVDGSTTERALEVQLDPRVEITPEALTLQTELSMRCYEAYHRLQEVREAIDERLEAGIDEDWLRAFRGERDPGDPDIIYGSIYASEMDDETVAGLQHKLLFLLNLLQGADARPTTQARQAVEALEARALALAERWAAMDS